MTNFGFPPNNVKISIHALREESDQFHVEQFDNQHNFNPRSP